MKWIPHITKGKDGKYYWVFTIHTAGRGWHARQFFTPTDNKYREIEVSPLPMKGKHQGILVQVLDDLSFPVLAFAKRPYNFNPVTHPTGYSSDAFKLVYGIFEDMNIDSVKYIFPETLSEMIPNYPVTYLYAEPKDLKGE